MDLDKDALRGKLDHAMAVEAPVLGDFFLSRFFGASFSYPDDGRCVVDANVEPFMLNVHGALHGGAVAFFLDIAMGHLIAHVAGGAGATVEMKVQYLRAIPPGPIRCEATILKRGRRLSFLEAKLLMANGEAGAAATGTFIMPQRDGA